MAEIGPAYICIAQISGSEIGPAQIGPGKPGFTQIRSIEIGSAQIGTAEVCPAKIDFAQIRLSQVNSVQFNLRVVMIFSPSVPGGGYLLLQQVHLLLICHADFPPLLRVSKKLWKD